MTFCEFTCRDTPCSEAGFIAGKASRIRCQIGGCFESPCFGVLGRRANEAGRVDACNCKVEGHKCCVRVVSVLCPKALDTMFDGTYPPACWIGLPLVVREVCSISMVSVAM